MLAAADRYRDEEIEELVQCAGCEELFPDPPRSMTRDCQPCPECGAYLCTWCTVAHADDGCPAVG